MSWAVREGGAWVPAMKRVRLGGEWVPGVVPTFDPATVFANGEQGFILDPSDMSTLWADTARETPATLTGTVAVIDDKSGRGNHMTFSATAARPQLLQDGTGRNFLRFNGVSNAGSTQEILSASKQAQMFLGARDFSGGDSNCMLEARGFFEAPGSWRIGVSSNRRYSASVRMAGNNNRYAGYNSPIPATPDLAVQVFCVDTTQTANETAAFIYNVNGVDARAEAAGIFTTGAVAIGGNALIDLGSRAGSSLFAEMDFYGAVLRYGPNLPAQTVSELEAYMAEKTGVTL